MYVSRWPLFVHAAVAIFQMFCSAYYHNYMCQSKQRMYFLRKFDLVGITLMICGSCTPPFYYGFMCEEDSFYRNLYLVQVWFFCLIALIVSLLPS